jgi:hypothetical protein
MKRPGLLRAALAGGVAVVLTGGLGFTGVASAKNAVDKDGDTYTLSAENARELEVQGPGPGGPSSVVARSNDLPRSLTYTFSVTCESVAPPLCPTADTRVPAGEYTLTSDNLLSSPVKFNIPDAPTGTPTATPPAETPPTEEPPPPPPPEEPPAPVRTPAPSGGVGAASLAGALGALTLPGEATEEEQREFRGPDVAEPPPLAAAPLIGGEFDRLLDFPEGMEPLLADDDREPGGAEAIFPDEPSFLATLLGAVEAEQALKSLAVMLLLLLTAAHVRSFIKAPTPEDSALD